MSIDRNSPFFSYTNHELAKVKKIYSNKLRQFKKFLRSLPTETYNQVSEFMSDPNSHAVYEVAFEKHMDIPEETLSKIQEKREDLFYHEVAINNLAWILEHKIEPESANGVGFSKYTKPFGAKRARSDKFFFHSDGQANVILAKVGFRIQSFMV